MLYTRHHETALGHCRARLDYETRLDVDVSYRCLALFVSEIGRYWCPEDHNHYEPCRDTRL
jgi:hypothetical protein